MLIVDDISKIRNNSRNGIFNESLSMQKTQNWGKTLGENICGDCGKTVKFKVKIV